MFNSKSKSEAEYQKEESNLLPVIHDRLDLHNELVDFLKFYSINSYISNINTLLHDMEKYLPTNTCLPFYKKTFLTTRNKLLPCEKVNYKYCMGEVNKNVMIDIPKLTKKYNIYYNHIKKTCQYCYSYKFCGVCLFIEQKKEKMDAEDFTCDKFCDQTAFKDKLYRIFSFLEKHPNDFFQILENVVLE